MPENVSDQPTGQCQGDSKSQSQHESNWADVREHSRLSAFLRARVELQELQELPGIVRAIENAFALLPLGKDLCGSF